MSKRKGFTLMTEGRERERAFTLIEVIVVMGISALLLGLVVAGQREFSRRKVVDNEAVTIAANLRQIQSLSTTGVKPQHPTPNFWYCTNDGRLDGYSVTFSATGYSVNAICTSPTSPPRNVLIDTYTYSNGVTARRYPSQPIIFKTIGRGTNLTTTQTVGICANNYGQEIVINEKGDISYREYNCSVAASPTASATPLPPTSLVISNIWVASGRAYRTSTLSIGGRYYIDRTYTITNSAGSRLFDGYSLIMTSNDDHRATANPFLTFTINRSAVVFVAYDISENPRPSWLSSWTDLGVSITTSDSSANHRVYTRSFPAGTVSLGGNSGASGSSMYFVLVR
jgi:prepilin-type N-terminal cleavage/methylation domain-containing protein